MCFQLYASTTKPIARIPWNQEAPGINVADINEQERSVRKYFTQSEVQYIGSTSHCGCDFPHLMFQNGGWPAPWAEKEPGRAASDEANQKALATLLRNTGEHTVELYGVWSGNFSEPKSREDISITDILEPKFLFQRTGLVYGASLMFTVPAALPSL